MKFLIDANLGPEKRFEMIKDALDKAKGKFVVVEEGQIRVRKL